MAIDARGPTESFNKRLAELLKDDDEQDPEQEGERPRPGSITKLGVRVDRGQGLLGTAHATETLQQMDSTISSIKSWHKEREQTIAALRAKHAETLDASDHDRRLHHHGLCPLPVDMECYDEPQEGQPLQHNTSSNRGPLAGTLLLQQQAPAASQKMTGCDFARLPDKRVNALMAGGQLRPVLTDAGACTLADQQRAALCGQHAQQLKQLEEELRELDAALVAPGFADTWQADVDLALARLDALQTGYQVQTQQSAAVPGNVNEAYQPTGLGT